MMKRKINAQYYAALGIQFVLQDMAESAYILFAPPILSFGNVVEEKGFL